MATNGRPLLSTIDWASALLRFQNLDEMEQLPMKAIATVAVIAALTTGCSTWGNMSRADKGTVIGAGAGAAVGNAVTGGGVLGTVGGAAVGGVVGREVGRDRR